MGNTRERHVNPWWVAVVSGMASFIDSSAIISSGTALVIYQQVFGLDNAQFGIISASLTLCIAIGSIVGGRLGDKFGRKPVFSVTMCLLILGAIMLVFAQTFPLLLAGEILMGFGVGADLPVSLATIAEEAPDEKRGKMLLFSDILWVIGIVSAKAIGALVGDWGYLGGQIMFGQLALISIIVLLARQTIPESPVWIQHHQDVLSGRVTEAQQAKVGDLLKNPYLKPFIALVIFYIGTNVPANSIGQYSTWIGANVVDLPISLVSTVGLICYPIQALCDAIFMKFVDGNKRMPLFYMGAAIYVCGFLMFPVFGANLYTYVLTQLLFCMGAGFAFEGMLKVWMQECFPTLLRTTANGAIVFSSRFMCSLAGSVTATFIAVAGYKAAFGVLAAMAIIGYAAAIWCFHKKRYNAFEMEAEAEAQAAKAE